MFGMYCIISQIRFYTRASEVRQASQWVILCLRSALKVWNMRHREGCKEVKRVDIMQKVQHFHLSFCSDGWDLLSCVCIHTTCFWIHPSIDEQGLKQHIGQQKKSMRQQFLPKCTLAVNRPWRIPPSFSHCLTYSGIYNKAVLLAVKSAVENVKNNIGFKYSLSRKS